MSSVVPGIIACGSRREIYVGENCDPEWGNVVLAMHMDSEISDIKGHSTTVYGSVAIVTDVDMVGGKAGSFDGSSRIVVADSDDFTLNGDFGIELQAKTTDETAYRSVLSNITLNADSWANGVEIFTKDGVWKAALYDSGASPTTVIGPAATIAKQHISLCRVGSTVTLYVDGVGGTGVTWANTLNAKGLTIGNAWDTATRGWVGLINEVLMYKNTSPRTANFTPPTAQFAESCYIPISDVPAFLPTIKEVVTETPPEFVPDPTPVALTGAGGRMLVNIGSYSYQVRRDASFYDNLVKFNSSTYEVVNVSQSFGACDPVYAESGRFLGCANTDHSIHSICTDGTYLYLSAYKDLRKYDSSLNIVENVTSSVTYDQLCYANSYLWAVSGVNVYKLDPTTLLEISNFTITSYDNLVYVDTDGTDLFVIKRDTASDFHLLKYTTSTDILSTLATGLSKRNPIVVGSYVYVGNKKIDKSTGTVSSLSFSLNTDPYQADHSHWSVFGTIVAVLKEEVPLQSVIIVDTSDDSVVSTLTNFQETASYAGGTIYSSCQGVGLISESKLIISNTSPYVYDKPYSGYSIYELI